MHHGMHSAHIVKGEHFLCPIKQGGSLLGLPNIWFCTQNRSREENRGQRQFRI